MALRFGRYETLREIAAGGMAVVYLGRAVGEGGFERRVAIKVMHPHLARDDEFVTMFLDEARLAAGIHHPNVVGTIDVQKTGEGMFLVMDYVEGASLQELGKYLKQDGEQLPLGIALRVMLDTLTGLHAAHELCDAEGQLLNLVHRDVSPQNILVGTDGVARLTDFGVARASARLSSTRGGQLKGKLCYMPPEQIMAEEVDRRSDVYAAGVVLWEVLVGKRLFRAKSDGEVVHKILESSFAAPHEKNDRVPLSVSDACMRALSLAPDHRYPTAAAFADDLEDAAHTQGIPVASSRAVASFMKALLPELEANRPVDRTLTPPSGLSQISPPSAAPAQPSTSEPSSPASEQPGGLASPTAQSNPSIGSSTRTEAVLPQPDRPKLRGGPIVAAGAIVVLGALGAVLLWPGGEGEAVSAAAARADGPESGDDTSSGEPASTTPATTAEPTADASAEPTADAGAEPSVHEAAAADGGATAAKPSATPVAPRPTRPRPRPVDRTQPKPSLTDYDPNEL